MRFGVLWIETGRHTKCSLGIHRFALRFEGTAQMDPVHRVGSLKMSALPVTSFGVGMAVEPGTELTQAQMGLEVFRIEVLGTAIGRFGIGILLAQVRIGPKLSVQVGFLRSDLDSFAQCILGFGELALLQADRPTLPYMAALSGRIRNACRKQSSASAF